MSRTDSAQDLVRVAVRITGVVQGVGFRPFIYRLASQQRLVGFVNNDGRGVYIEVQGKPESVDTFLERVREERPPAAAVFSVESKPMEIAAETAFSIRQSGEKEPGPLPVSPDLATCDKCLTEIFTSTDRRYRYPFTNCTDCGPRFTIVASVPYDRPNTTMKAFRMCPSCRAEYDDPGDRRFHAQPNACPDCGPQIELVERGRRLAQGDLALKTACRLLAQGEVVAVKGVGGYHLACDGCSESAVSGLRRRKHRYDRPFALMVRDIETAVALCFLSQSERVLLESAAAPIVLLVRKSPGSSERLSKPPAGGWAGAGAGDASARQSGSGTLSAQVAPSVAPGLRRLGLMLPYTPLHHMLLRDGPPVLVMTSGNVSEEPIAYHDEEAMARLDDLADAFLVHDRPIQSRCDDSVAWIPDGGRPQMVRRSRGYAPAPLSMPVATPVPTLAVGGHFKNAFCLAERDTAYLSHHIGDTSNAEALRSFEEGVKHCKELFSIEPKAVAHDMHPDYLTTKYARQLGLSPSIPVQHHHAHVASCMAENDVPPGTRVLGAAFDGSGYGPDGTIWGGEFLLCTYRDFERYSHMGYMPIGGVHRREDPGAGLPPEGFATESFPGAGQVECDQQGRE
jgi:hydrogenase maturation protein HypF